MNLYGQASKPSEYDVEAAYLYNFGKFVQWPTGSPNAAASIFTLCVIGDDPLEAKLQAVVSKETINGQHVAVKRLSGLRGASHCQVLFIPAREEDLIGRDLEEVRRAPVLTVSDSPDFTRHGGMIGFVIQNHRVRFEVNIAAARKAGLQLSSELLKVAVNVTGEGGRRAR